MNLKNGIINDRTTINLIVVLFMGKFSFRLYSYVEKEQALKFVEISLNIGFFLFNLSKSPISTIFEV